MASQLVVYGGTGLNQKLKKEVLRYVVIRCNEAVYALSRHKL